MKRLLATACVVTVTAACAGARHPPATPVFTGAPWRIRLDVDSAPSRRVPPQPIFGTIDFAKGRYSIDLFRGLGRQGLADTVRISPVPAVAPDSTKRYRIILGDSSSFDDKLVMSARVITADSLIGTWSETILCCSAAGRFTLWRAAATPPR